MAPSMFPSVTPSPDRCTGVGGEAGFVRDGAGELWLTEGVRWEATSGRGEGLPVE